MNEKVPKQDVVPVKIVKPEGTLTKPNYAARNRIYVRAVKGTFENIRRFGGLIFLSVFALIPWLQYDGQQAVLLNLAEQRFNIFALTLWPQDLTILAYSLIVAAFGLFFITTFAGRVWCGFIKIEGPRNKRIKLDERKMDADKFIRKSLKHFSWVAVALLTSLTFVGYFVPIDDLFINFFTFNTGFWVAFWVLFFTFCTYANAGYMREVMCTHMCPYARFQSAMFDKDTYTVAYNAQRGEQRGPRTRKMTQEQVQAKGLGDCIDCNLCVQVCPTGIDIRNGLQYECINCGACVDACNGVMEKMGYEKNLISFTSEHELKGGTTKIFRSKLIGYAGVLCVMTSLLVFDVVSRVPLEVDIIRDRNSLDRETNAGLIENVYTLKILNKSQRDRTYIVNVRGLVDARYIGDSEVKVSGGGVYTLPISVAVDPANLELGTQKIYFRVSTNDDQDNVVEKETATTFIFTGL